MVRRAQLALLAACVLPCATERRPNILLAVVDDLGYADVGYNAQGKATALSRATPNIDALAAEGVKLRSFYASPECTPTRAMLLTGRHTVHTGLQDSVIHGTEPRGVPLEEIDVALYYIADDLVIRGEGSYSEEDLAQRWNAAREAR